MTSSFGCFGLAMLVLSVLAAAGAVVSPHSMAERHEQWMALHRRVYSSEEEKALRLKIFEENVNLIEAFNRAREYNYTLGVNQFADMTIKEFHDSHVPCIGSQRALSPSSSSTGKAPSKSKNGTVAALGVDWRAKGAVSSVKEQGGCGSCWAFAVVGAVEGAVKIKKGKLLSLSVQEVVDCDTGGRDHGCFGGYLEDAFQFIVKNGGLPTEATYPYKKAQSPCDATKKPAAKITGYRNVKANDQEALRQAVARQPVAITIDVSGFSFQFYKSGVLAGPCTATANHAMVAVGYGANLDGTKYWLMKNSWGSGWGEGGYLRVRREDSGVGICAITSSPAYPIA